MRILWREIPVCTSKHQRSRDVLGSDFRVIIDQHHPLVEAVYPVMIVQPRIDVQVSNAIATDKEARTCVKRPHEGIVIITEGDARSGHPAIFSVAGNDWRRLRNSIWGLQRGADPRYGCSVPDDFPCLRRRMSRRRKGKADAAVQMQ